ARTDAWRGRALDAPRPGSHLSGAQNPGPGGWPPAPARTRVRRGTCARAAPGAARHAGRPVVLRGGAPRRAGGPPARVRPRGWGAGGVRRIQLLLECDGHPVGRRAPELDGAVRAAGGECLSVRRKRDRPDRSAVATEGEPLLAGGHIPEPGSGVVAARGERQT